MATPVYGKQFIRFAETGLVDDAVSLSQFRVVEIDATAATEPPTIKLMEDGNTAAFGVLQQDVDAVDPDKATTGQRLGTVATSGLLLVMGDDQKKCAVNTALETKDGVAVGDGSGTSGLTINGGIATVRQEVYIGGEYYVLVSFS